MSRSVTEHSETAFDDRELNSAVKVRTFAFGRLFLYLCNNANNVFFPMYGATFGNQCALLLSHSVICSAKKNTQTSQRQNEHFFFHWRNPHSPLCCSSIECSSLTYVASFKREINSLPTSVWFNCHKAHLQHRNNEHNTNVLIFNF